MYWDKCSCSVVQLFIGDKDELVAADQADDDIEQPEQAAQAENTAPADEAEPDEVPWEMEHSLPAPTAFNIDVTDLYSEWKHWSTAFEIYSIASDPKKKEDAGQRLPQCCVALAPQCNAISTRSLANIKA